MNSHVQFGNYCKFGNYYDFPYRVYIEPGANYSQINRWFANNPYEVFSTDWSRRFKTKEAAQAFTLFLYPPPKEKQKLPYTTMFFYQSTDFIPSFDYFMQWCNENTNGPFTSHQHTSLIISWMFSLAEDNLLFNLTFV